MHAIEPTSTGFATNHDDGAQIAYKVYGPPDATRTIVLLPTWIIIDSRFWKGQVPYFAQRGFRVVTYDGRGSGRSDRPPSGYSADYRARDAIAVMDAIGLEQAILIGLSAGVALGVRIAGEYPERVSHLVVMGGGITPGAQGRARANIALDAFLAEPTSLEGWGKYNAVYWRRNYREFIEWFVPETINQPHATKAIDDSIEWALDATIEALVASVVEQAPTYWSEFAPAVACPTLIIHGEEDRLASLESARNLNAAIPQSRLVVVGGGAHSPSGGDPVKANLLIHDFLGREWPREQTWRRAASRATKRALYISSPIGLGHAQRDAAIADELRRLVPGLEIDWLAQPPVTTFLAARGERIHPLSDQLAGESAHIESELCGEHTLPIFQAFRNMDEILLANFHVFLDAAQQGNYDLWIGDEAWDVDFYLHENPELKTAPFVWLTDAVAMLPMSDDPDSREAFVTTDYNAQMIEQVERYPRVRDRALFIGEPDDIAPGTFGAGLPDIRDWTERHYDFPGYVLPFDPASLDREALRARFGFGSGEQVAVAAVGGTRVGTGLLRRIIAAYPAMRERVPDLRLVVVGGPRVAVGELAVPPGVELRGYVHNLYELFAAGDVALVQGGLSTTMELVATGRPFLYFPLDGHFEQSKLVPHRLERYGVPDWAKIPFAEATPEVIGERLGRALREPVRYRPIPPGAARRAAERIASLL